MPRAVVPCMNESPRSAIGEEASTRPAEPAFQCPTREGYAGSPTCHPSTGWNWAGERGIARFFQYPDVYTWAQ